MNPHHVPALAAAVCAAAVVACGGRGEQPLVQGAPPAHPLAPAVRLLEQGGRVFDLAEQRGKVVLLFFGYTHCPDVCPTTMVDFVSVRRRLGPRAEQVRFVFISVDPARDTPEGVQAYARGFDRTFIGLSGDSASLAGIQRGFKIGSYIEQDSSGDYTVAHSASVFLIGPDGRIGDTLRFGEARAEEMYQAVVKALGT